MALMAAIFKTEHNYSFIQKLPQGSTEIAFLIAFLGWMPAPLDISTWHSLWTLEKIKTTTKGFATKKALFDFNVGYITTVILGICFISLGALVMFYSEEELSASASLFAQQLINIYTSNLGKGAALFIAIAAFTTMFSTTITTLDASPRAMARSSELLLNKKSNNFYLIWILLLAFGTISILSYFKTSMITFVKIATILSFLTAPFYAIANFMLVNGKHMPKDKRPSVYLQILSYLGIIFLILFSLWYLLS